MIHNGTAIDIPGQTVPICFTWGALAALRAVFGPGWQEAVSMAVRGGVAASLAVLEAASDRPAAWWTDQPVTEVQARLAIGTAWAIATNGPAGKAPTVPDGVATEPGDGDPIEVAFVAWASWGGDPEAFWRLTPWQSATWVRGAMERAKQAARQSVEQAWITAALTAAASVGKLPPLEVVLGDPPKRMTADEIAAVFHSAAAKRSST